MNIKKHLKIKIAVLVLLFIVFITFQPVQGRSIFERIFQANIFEIIRGTTNCALELDNCYRNFEICKSRIKRGVTICGERKEKQLKRCDQILERIKNREVFCQERYEKCAEESQKMKARCEYLRDNQDRFQNCIDRAESRLQRCNDFKASCDSQVQRNKEAALEYQRICVDMANSSFKTCQRNAISYEIRIISSCNRRAESCIRSVKRRCFGI